MPEKRTETLVLLGVCYSKECYFNTLSMFYISIYSILFFTFSIWLNKEALSALIQSEQNKDYDNTNRIGKLSGNAA